MRTKRRDILTVAALIILVLFLGAGLLNRGHEWGDDFAAYMMQARAIANGTMEEQGYINRVIHASRMDFSNDFRSMGISNIMFPPYRTSFKTSFIKVVYRS